VVCETGAPRLSRRLPSPMTSDQSNEPGGAAFTSSATGWSVLGVGLVCVVVGFIVPMFVDVNAVGSPAVGMPGLRLGGVGLIGFGLFLVASGRKR
jgi:hypothetical protein